MEALIGGSIPCLPWDTSTAGACNGECQGRRKPTVNQIFTEKPYWIQLGNYKNLTCFGGTFEMLLNMHFPVEGFQTAVINLSRDR